MGLAEIIRRYGADYQAKYGTRMLPSHRVALKAIEQCRTEALGGHVYYCDRCEEACYSYHSCQNRHCPKCQQQAGQGWLERQQNLLLPVPYFMVTFTLPADLRALARSQQKLVYNLLFRTSAEALQQLTRDQRFVGGQIGMVGVLHTWARDLSYHPHVHYLLPGGGLSADGQRWLKSGKNFLVHVKPLMKLFRAKFRTALQQTAWFEQVPAQVWRQSWVVHCQPVGRGQAALKYLAPYIFRVAISNNRIVNSTTARSPFAIVRPRVASIGCVPYRRKPFFIASYSTCYPRVLSRSAIMGCLVPVSDTDYSRPEPYWGRNRPHPTLKSSPTRSHLMIEIAPYRVRSVGNRCAGNTVSARNEGHLELKLGSDTEICPTQRLFVRSAWLEVGLK